MRYAVQTVPVGYPYQYDDGPDQSSMLLIGDRSTHHSFRYHRILKEFLRRSNRIIEHHGNCSLSRTPNQDRT
eukprot:scaffold60770_cov20-Attheya_sp.AAC.1